VTLVRLLYNFTIQKELKIYQNFFFRTDLQNHADEKEKSCYFHKLSLYLEERKKNIYRSFRVEKFQI
jgi:hypothetical protein